MSFVGLLITIETAFLMKTLDKFTAHSERDCHPAMYLNFSSTIISVRSSVRLLLWDLKDLLIDILSHVLFAIFDVVDQLLCPLFAFLDWQLDKHEAPCYCDQVPQNLETAKKRIRGVDGVSGAGVVAECEHWAGPSNTLYARKYKQGSNPVHLNRSISGGTVESQEFLNARYGGRNCIENLSADSSGANLSIGKKRMLDVTRMRELETGNLLSKGTTSEAVSENGLLESISYKARWSDCGCITCTAWRKNIDLLHVHVDGKDVSGTSEVGCCGDDTENNVIFIHGFLSSSSFWVETVFPVLSDRLRSSHRLFAVDVLGFGKSPKPTDCMYSNADHVDMIRKSVIERFGIKKYHLVAHSMGCTIALSMAGQDPSAVKSITLVSPPYHPAEADSQASSHLLWKVAPKRIFPVIAFGSSVMSWYEHLGRVVCLVICKNHHFWEPVLAFTCNKLLRLRIPRFFFHDFMQHTHNAAWHNFHNTICSGAHTTEWSMKILLKAGKSVRVIHGDNDNICPIECTLALRQRYSNVSVSKIPGANHVTVVLGREKEMARELEAVFSE